jgi:hypothetical protein
MFTSVTTRFNLLSHTKPQASPAPAVGSNYAVASAFAARPPVVPPTPREEVVIEEVRGPFVPSETEDIEQAILLGMNML